MAANPGFSCGSSSVLEVTLDCKKMMVITVLTKVMMMMMMMTVVEMIMTMVLTRTDAHPQLTLKVQVAREHTLHSHITTCGYAPRASLATQTG